jgi:hypothetical protein
VIISGITGQLSQDSDEAVGWLTVVQFLGKALKGFFFSFHHCIQTGSEVHSASYAVGTRDSFLGG